MITTHLDAGGTRLSRTKLWGGGGGGTESAGA